jgi:hypothetical protein
MSFGGSLLLRLSGFTIAERDAERPRRPPDPNSQMSALRVGATRATPENVPVSYDEWRAAYGLTPERDAPFTTLSGEEIRPLYTERDLPTGVGCRP